MDITGSIQEKNGKYCIIYRINKGSQHWKSTGIKIPKTGKRKAEEEARAFMYSFFEALKKQKQDEEEVVNLLFVEFLKLWLIDHKPKVKATTYAEYERAVNSTIIPFFKRENLFLKDIKPRHIEAFFLFLKDKKHLCAKSITNYKSILSKAMKYAYVNDMIEKNPADKAEIPLIEREKFVPTIYTHEQMRDLLEEASKSDPQVEVFLYLTASTGARRGEILGLTWDDIDFDRKTISFNQAMTQNSKKSAEKLSTLKTENSYRKCFLPDSVIDLLKKEKERQENLQELFGKEYVNYQYDFVIRQDDGKIYNCPQYMNRKVNKLIKKAGLPHCRIHDIRHYVATLLFENDTPLRKITAQLGHGQSSTTERIYIHSKNVNDQATCDTISAIIGL